jgi:hypothetical protein
MGIRCYFGRMTRNQREALEMILHEEIDVQLWYAITYSRLMREEIFIAVQ